MTQGKYYLAILIIGLSLLSVQYPLIGAIMLTVIGAIYLVVFVVWLYHYIRDAIMEHEMLMNEKPVKQQPYQTTSINPINDVYRNWGADKFNVFDQGLNRNKLPRNKQ